MKISKMIALLIVLAMMAAPALSYARAGGGSGGRGSGGYSTGGGTSPSVGSRGSRTYENNGYKPIEKSMTPQPAPNASGLPRTATAPTAAPQPAAQPSFFQRHPILTGLAAGLAGSWIGHMLFGANNSMAAEGDAAAEQGSSMLLLFIVMVLGAGAVYYFMKVRRPTAAPAYSGMSRSSLAEGNLTAPASSTGSVTTPAVSIPLTRDDEAAFKQMLMDVQNAWAKPDMEVLKRLTTPEMLHYFHIALTENVSKGVENHIEDLRVTSTEVRESWTEDGMDYATVLLRWTARDYMVSLNKRPGELGYVAEGDDKRPIELSEAWTFMRSGGGRWIVSAIQQVQ